MTAEALRQAGTDAGMSQVEAAAHQGVSQAFLTHGKGKASSYAFRCAKGSVSAESLARYVAGFAPGASQR
jgi:hypothetical protein